MGAFLRSGVWGIWPVRHMHIDLEARAGATEPLAHTVGARHAQSQRLREGHLVLGCDSKWSL